MVYVTRKVHFNAAHKMYNPAWGKEKNQNVFGPCSNENWHGHNYELEVTVCGNPHPDTGYVVDLRWLNQLIEEKVLSKVDHRNLNLDVDFMQGIIPSAENLAIAIWKELAPHILPPAFLYSIRIFETPRNFVEYRGE